MGESSARLIISNLKISIRRLSVETNTRVIITESLKVQLQINSILGSNPMVLSGECLVTELRVQQNSGYKEQSS